MTTEMLIPAMKMLNHVMIYVNKRTQQLDGLYPL